MVVDESTVATVIQLAIFVSGIDNECNVVVEMTSLLPLEDPT